MEHALAESVLITGSMVVSAAVGIALAAHWLMFAALARIAKHTTTHLDDLLVMGARRPIRMLLVLMAVLLVIPVVGLPEGGLEAARRGVALMFTVTMGWLAIGLTGVVEEWVKHRFPLDVPDNLRARQIHTQVRILRRIAVSGVVVVVSCLVLMAFESVRQLGISLFASAGVAGLVIGMAARPALSNLIAGIQLAFTGPIHIDDVVIVEGEWGTIEEIGAAHVVVRIWDLRRLIVPLGYFIEHPFENWTRRTADILGTVFIHADYGIPVEPVRRRLHEIVSASNLWDGKVCGLQVTDADHRTVQLRALMSAADASKAWDLRCHVREQLIGFLQSEYPHCLPRVRAELPPATLPSGRQ